MIRKLTLITLAAATTLLAACSTMPGDSMKKPAQPDQNPAHQMHYGE